MFSEYLPTNQEIVNFFRKKRHEIFLQNFTRTESLNIVVDSQFSSVFSYQMIAYFKLVTFFLYKKGRLQDSVRETLIRMENEMKEMKEKLVSLMASAEECRDRGQS